MAGEAEKALGALVGRYETDNRRRGTVALIALLVGLAATAVTVPVVIETFDSAGAQGGTGSGRLAGLLGGVALLGLWGGISRGSQYLRLHGEVFHLREGGLVHRRTGETRVIPWSQIRGVRDRGQSNFVSRPLGWDVHCTIRVRGGRRLLITGFTPGAERLVAAVDAAARQGVPPRAV
ncbi:hypothetical protein [Streptomyces aidingensis]|uniref:Uncharacterized protein n=1 Tax=Streptomyces aidingensis TaxID=910347 RepID=A0A1I1GXY4_9ACTN|nr:hypothetical protein [Streptomyces aidingensis]SFC16385.1 hypothetical protein SAMN05421773_102171 [Streptomyces aidingensis]